MDPMICIRKSNSNGPLNHGGKGKTMYYVIQCRFSEFLIQLCIKKTLFIGAEQIYYCVLFWGPCRNITDQEPGGAGVSCRAIFGVCDWLSDSHTETGYETYLLYNS